MVKNLQSFDFFKSDQKINLKIDDELTINELVDILEEDHKTLKGINEAIIARNFKNARIEGNRIILEKSQIQIELLDITSYSKLKAIKEKLALKSNLLEKLPIQSS